MSGISNAITSNIFFHFSVSSETSLSQNSNLHYSDALFGFQ